MNILAAIALWAAASWCGELPPAAVPPGADAPSALREAYRAFLAGRLDAAAASYRYLALLGITAPDPGPSLAILSRDMGRPEAALPAWTKASLEGRDAFLWSQRGWSYLSNSRPRDAIPVFRKALELSTTTAAQAEANIGLGLASLLDEHPKAAKEPLRAARSQGPYMIPLSAQLSGLTALAMGDRQLALAYLGESVGVDPLNREALRELARLYQKVGENRQAFRAWQAALLLDPDDSDAAAAARKVSKYLPATPEALRPVRRLSRPMLDAGAGEPEDPTAPRIRVAVFSGSDGVGVEATRLYVMANAAFRLTAAGGEVVRDDGRAMAQWAVEFRPESNIVEVRDTGGVLQYTSKQAFRFEPAGANGSVLIKSAVLREEGVADPGDRELRGVVEIVPTPYGFKIVNDLPLEHYLYGAVPAALTQRSPMEAYKAQSVVARTRALWHKTHRRENFEKADLCDSDHCQRYLGLNAELAAATQAVRETRGVVLRRPGGGPANVADHANCGGFTESPEGFEGEGLDHLRPVADSANPAPLAATAADLERWMHSYPPRDRYCEAGSLSPAVEARWIRLIDASELSRRAQVVKALGTVRHIRALSRTPSGRIRSLEVQGTRENLIFEGEPAIRQFLSPGSLRSTLFTIQPLYQGAKATHFVLWGAGTGHGRGLCQAGAVGQASLGRVWRQILAHYFPGLDVHDPRAPARKAASETGKRRRNPRLKR